MHNISFTPNIMINAYNLVKAREYRSLEIYVKLGFRFNIFDINQDIAKDFGCLSEAMMFALEYQNCKLFSLNKEELLFKNNCSYNALSFAVIADNIDAVKYIYSRCNKLNQLNQKNENLLHLAAKYKSHKSLKYLLQNMSLSFLNKKNNQGFTPLLLAASRNDYEALNILVQIINKKQLLTTNKFGANIIHWLAFNNIKDRSQSNFLEFLKINKLDNSKYFHRNAININPKDWLNINKSNLTTFNLY